MGYGATSLERNWIFYPNLFRDKQSYKFWCGTGRVGGLIGIKPSPECKTLTQIWNPEFMLKAICFARWMFLHSSSIESWNLWNDKLIPLARFFNLWRTEIDKDDSCVSMLDYKDMPWLAETSQFKVGVLDSSSQQWPVQQMAHLREMAEMEDEPERSIQLEWIDRQSICTYVALGVGQLYHGFPILHHFGVDDDPLWSQFKLEGSNAYATRDEDYHVSLAICGGFPRDLDRIRLQELLLQKNGCKY